MEVDGPKMCDSLFCVGHRWVTVNFVNKINKYDPGDPCDPYLFKLNRFNIYYSSRGSCDAPALVRARPA